MKRNIDDLRRKIAAEYNALARAINEMDEDAIVKNAQDLRGCLLSLMRMDEIEGGITDLEDVAFNLVRVEDQYED